jgi:DNA/RNA-binding domain of Phe-tRNA-synthetase-like protein
VDANFASEVETLVLTAGHDVAQLREPVWLDVSGPGEMQTRMNGDLKEILAGDMIMRDAGGVCCSILYGQDHRSAITAATEHVLYVSYAPPGVPPEVVEAHLRNIEANVLLVSPGAIVEQLTLISASGS